MTVPTTFRVSVAEMVESHRKTYWVWLERGDRPKDAKPWDDGVMSPFMHENRKYAESMAKDWAKFLGVEVTPPPHPTTEE